MAVTVEFASNGTTASGYLALPERLVALGERVGSARRTARGAEPAR